MCMCACVWVNMTWMLTCNSSEYFWEIADAKEPIWSSTWGHHWKLPPSCGQLQCSWLSFPQPSSAVGVHTSSSTYWTILVFFQTPRNASTPLWSFRTSQPWTVPSTHSSTVSSAALSAVPAGKRASCLGQCREPLYLDSDMCLFSQGSLAACRWDAWGSENSCLCTNSNPGPGHGPCYFFSTTSPAVATISLRSYIELFVWSFPAWISSVQYDAVKIAGPKALLPCYRLTKEGSWR